MIPEAALFLAPSPQVTKVPDAALLIACAREYLETPWRHQARLRGVGVDCVGLLVCAARDAGLEVNDVPANYATVPSHGWLLTELEVRLVRVDVGEIQAGDVLAFAWSLHPWHAGLVTSVDGPALGAALKAPTISLIHAYRRAGKCVEQRLEASWLGAIHSAWRWPQWQDRDR